MRGNSAYNSFLCIKNAYSSLRREIILFDMQEGGWASLVKAILIQCSDSN